MEVPFEVIFSKHKAEAAHNSNGKVLIAERGSELYSAGLLDYIKSVLFVVEPGHTHLEAVVDIVVRVSELVQVLDDVFVETADDASLVVELQDAQVGQQLALFHVFELRAAHSRVQIVVLHGATVVS